MCLGIPGKIIEIYEQSGLQMGKIDFGGAAREVCLAYVPEAKIGDYAIVHVGFALNLLDEAEAQETLALLKQIGVFGEGLSTEGLSTDFENGLNGLEGGLSADLGSGLNGLGGGLSTDLGSGLNGLEGKRATDLGDGLNGLEGEGVTDLGSGLNGLGES